MPLYREANPSPVGALHYLLDKIRNGKPVNFPVKNAPWPILAVLATSHFPTKECDWVWGRFDAKPDDKKLVDNARIQPINGQSWGYYTLTYGKAEVVCKESIWHPDALPRIPEDGGMCGRLAYIGIGVNSCMGKPLLSHSTKLQMGTGLWKNHRGFGLHFTLYHTIFYQQMMFQDRRRLAPRKLTIWKLLYTG